ncbi:GNAT family N-acetyltransferase [Stutzerimonas nitrititolerans]|uniref:GNAT family N-acetyltransferase n=1 Tax=Stutzerimonas nitrititolerans TaxID=2482751 RepID=UPI0028AF67C8|nr:GNAT family N-acetyltransferase [Stutzerimonas nitrititolerans]
MPQKMEHLLERKQKYRALCEQESAIPIFSQAWWLDSVAGDDWDVVLVEKGNIIQASLPYVLRKRMGMTIISQPVLTQNLGPWLRPSSAKYAKQLSQEKDLLQELYARLPAHAFYRQSWHCSRSNWLPLYWQGYQQTTRYTYRIEALSDMEGVWADTQANIRTDIRKAEKQVSIRTDLSFERFIDLNRKVFERQGMVLPYTEALLRSIDSAAEARNVRQIFIAEDEQGRLHAGVYIIWDKDCAYYLMGGGDPDLRSSGATSLCMWHAIQFASTKVRAFDFEGSMLEPVERFCRAFGAKQTPYFSISKTNSKLLKTYFFLQSLRK